MLSGMTREQINESSQNKLAAEIAYDADSRPRWIHREVIDLGTAQLETDPRIFGQPFDSFFVEDASDSLTNVKMAITGIDMSAIKNYVTLKKESGVAFKRAVRRAVLWWDSQPGKTITIVFFLDVEFRSGSLRQILDGGVTVTTGDVMTPQTGGTIAATAAQLFAANADRKLMVIQNQDVIPCWISGTADVTDDTGTKPGIKIEAGGSYEWDMQGACYIIGGAAGRANAIALNECE